MAIWRKVGLFEVTEQRLADQTRVFRGLSEIKLDEIQRKDQGRKTEKEWERARNKDGPKDGPQERWSTRDI